jgi:hypothetical protein
MGSRSAIVIPNPLHKSTVYEAKRLRLLDYLIQCFLYYLDFLNYDQLHLSENSLKDVVLIVVPEVLLHRIQQNSILYEIALLLFEHEVIAVDLEKLLMRARIITVAALMLASTLHLPQNYLLNLLSRPALGFGELTQLAQQRPAYEVLLPLHCFCDLPESLHLQLHTSRNRASNIKYFYFSLLSTEILCLTRR